MTTTYEILQGLAQASANAYDGAVDEDGKPIEIGLKREEMTPSNTRIMDGFGVKFHGGNVMCVSYHSECTLREVISGGFESDIEQQMSKVVSFLKKEYKRITGSSVTLTEKGELDVNVQNISRQRSLVLAKKYFNFSAPGLEESTIKGEPTEDKLALGWEKFLSQGGYGNRAPNDKRPKSEKKNK